MLKNVILEASNPDFYKRILMTNAVIRNIKSKAIAFSSRREGNDEHS
jgi:hypothetical protein